MGTGWAHTAVGMGCPSSLHRADTSLTAQVPLDSTENGHNACFLLKDPCEEIGTMLFSSERAALDGSQLIAGISECPGKAHRNRAGEPPGGPSGVPGPLELSLLAAAEEIPGVETCSAGYGSLGNCPVLGGSFTYGDFRPLEPDLQEALLRHWQCLDSWRWDALAWEANEGYGGGKHFQTT